MEVNLLSVIITKIMLLSRIPHVLRVFFPIIPFLAYLQTVPDQCLHMSEIYDAGTMDPDEVAFGQLAPDRCGTMDPDEVAFGQLAPDRCEVERNYEAAPSCQVDAGIISDSLYPLDFIYCRFEMVVPPPDKRVIKDV